MKKYLAIDIGASSGRHILGHLENGRIALEEVYRFDNSQIVSHGHHCWDVDALVASIKAGIDAALAKGPVESIGIDTWGVDFVLLDDKQNRVGDAVAYRDSRTQGMDAELERLGVSFDELYARTGIQKASYNTIYQLLALKKEHPEQLEKASSLLMMPEYLTFALTGRVAHEYTISSTTSLLNAEAKDWDVPLLDKLGLKRSLFGSLDMPGAVVGTYRGVKVVFPALHDTASAYLAVPARDETSVFLSSGTWSLLGVERSSPLTTPAAREANFTNEGGAWGRYRFLKNIMGLWMIQSIRRELNGVQYVEGQTSDDTTKALSRLTDWEKGHVYSFAELESLARSEADVPFLIDVNDARFLSPASMIGEVLSALREKGGSEAVRVGELVQCVYRSLADCYRREIENLSRLTGVAFSAIHIVGGGSKDRYLNDLTAEATGKKVLAGPTEATAIGNLIVQMIAGGTLRDLSDARAAIL